MPDCDKVLLVQAELEPWSETISTSRFQRMCGIA